MKPEKVFELPAGQQEYLEKLIESNMIKTYGETAPKEEVFGEPYYTLSLTVLKKMILAARVDLEVSRLFRTELISLELENNQGTSTSLDVLPTGELNMFVEGEPDIYRPPNPGQVGWPSVKWVHWFRANSGFGLSECRDKGILRRALLERRALESGK